MEPSKSIEEIKKDRCGIAPLLATSRSDPFLGACMVHDEIFQARHDALDNKRLKDPALNVSLEDANDDFYKTMDYVATREGSVMLHARKWLYYGIVKSLAWIWW